MRQSILYNSGSGTYDCQHILLAKMIDKSKIGDIRNCT